MRVPLLLASLLALGGCVGWDADDTHVASYQDPGVDQNLPRPSPFDGIYQGTRTLTSDEAGSCPRDASGLLEIGDGRLVLDYTPVLTLPMTIQPDGTLHAEDGTIVIDGKIADDELLMTVHTDSCQSSYGFSRILGM